VTTKKPTKIKKATSNDNGGKATTKTNGRTTGLPRKHFVFSRMMTTTKGNDEKWKKYGEGVIPFLTIFLYFR
jgi:hypothetical protein